MKRVLFVLLLFMLCSGTQAQQPQASPPSYSLHILIVKDTCPAQVLWLVDGADLYAAYKSPHAPILLQWVSGLPKGAQITYCSPWLSLPVIGRLLPPDAGAKKDLDDFGLSCKTRGVTFRHLTAANVPVL